MPIVSDTCLLFAFVVLAVRFWLTPRSGRGCGVAGGTHVDVAGGRFDYGAGLDIGLGIGPGPHEGDRRTDRGATGIDSLPLRVGCGARLDVDRAASFDLRVLTDRHRGAGIPEVDRDRERDEVEKRQIAGDLQGTVEQPADPLPPGREFVVGVFALVGNKRGYDGNVPRRRRDAHVAPQDLRPVAKSYRRRAHHIANRRKTQTIECVVRVDGRKRDVARFVGTVGLGKDLSAGVQRDVRRIEPGVQNGVERVRIAHLDGEGAGFAGGGVGGDLRGNDHATGHVHPLHIVDRQAAPIGIEVAVDK